MAVDALHQRVGDVSKMVDRHDQDLYRGNGKPGITTRIARLEDCWEEVADELKWIKRLLIGLLLTGIIDIIMRGRWK